MDRQPACKEKGLNVAVKLFYERYGSGLPVVCLHGYPLDHSIWNPLIPLLEPKVQLILPDLRGHGRSPVPCAPYSMQDMAEDVKVLLDDLSLQKVVLIGQSMGGYIALQFARSYPDRLSGLILAASHPYPDDEEKKKNRYASIEKVRREGVKEALAGFPEKLTPIPEIQDYTRKIINATSSEGVIGSLRAMAERLDGSDVLSTLEIPAAVILGKRDQFVSMQQREQMTAQFSKVQFAILENAAHMLMMEQPRQVGQLIVDFVSKIEE
jgi:pimeloyl-ACP methyl ester carboxylesterase